jgi:adenine/guanine phosphoribosyltransferase-like PRPP-binding protein
MAEYWQDFGSAPAQPVWHDHFDAPMPDGTTLRLPLRDLGETAVAGLIANQASFAVLDRLAAWTAAAAAPLAAEIVVGLPTLGHTVGAAVARALGHPNWVAPSTTRKRWYDDALSVPLASITSPATGANRDRRMWLDPRILPRLQGRRVVLVDDVISTGSSARAGLALLRAAGIEPVGLLVAMIQGQSWRTDWDSKIQVHSAFTTPMFRRTQGGWTASE